MSIIELDAFLDTFFEEADEHVAALESSLLGLDTAPDDRELMNAAFRAAHSLKGGSSMFGLTNITRFTHEMETLFDQVRKGTYAWEQSLATLFLKSVDVLRDLLAVKGATLSSEGEALMVELAQYARGVHQEVRGATRRQAGTVLLAPGTKQHMVLAREGHELVVRLVESAPVMHHRPSVDILFRSCAEVLGRRTVAALLTGMGSDGARGLLEIHKTGATTIAQDEASCVVYGMPMEAIALGAADHVLPIGAIGPSLVKVAQGGTI